MSTVTAIEKKVVRVGKYVNTEHVDSLIRNYKKERWMQNSERIGKNDTLGVWLTVDEMEEFIQTAKTYGADGIRLYFGVYGEGANRPEMNGKQTIALVATCSEQNKEGDLVQKDLYVNRNGENGLLAYNWLYPFPPTTTPVTAMLNSNQLGSLMISDKEQGLKVI
ncbi:MAG TPA: hypothetical protein VNS58_22520 [Puia sp.]|nr:hypothetical protein [Puia sp.]